MAQTKTVRLRFIETTDVHGHFFPYDFITGRETDGSLLRASTYINKVRNDYGERLILLENGDILQGQPVCYWSNYIRTDEENIAASLVNYMKYDVQVIGNHDVETGHAVYDKWIDEIKCPVLGANIIDRKTEQPYVRPYTMIERQGIKIAILGLITPTIASWLNEQLWRGLEFEEMVSCARYWVAHLRQVEHADVIIGLFHSGRDGGIQLDNGLEENASARVAREVPGFDIIFYGHDHQKNEEWITNADGQQVLLLNPANKAKNVADASIALTYTRGHLTDKHIEGSIVSVRDEDVDEDMMARFKSSFDRVKAYTDERIGYFETAMRTRDSYFGNSSFTDFIHNLQLQISGADISLNAPLSFDSKIDAGFITTADMFNLYRYENQLYVMTMTGREIRLHLEESYGRWINTMQSADDHLLLIHSEIHNGKERMSFDNPSFNFDSAAGIDYEVDVTKPKGQKVTILRMSDGQPFDENKTYKVVMNSYRGNGGGELLTKGAGIPKEELNKRIIYQSPLDLRHYLAEEIKRLGTVNPQPNHNWRFVPEAWTTPAAQRDRQLLFGE